MSRSQALPACAFNPEIKDRFGGERKGETTREDVGSDYKGSLFHKERPMHEKDLD